MMSIVEKISQRNFTMILAGSLLIIFASVVSYVLLPQVKSYRSSIADLAILEKMVVNKNDIQQELNSLKVNIDLAKRKLKGDMADLPEKEMEAYIIGILQNISWDNQVNLIGVKPVKGGEINIFQEVLFNVKISGDYFDLYNWFVELRSQLGFIVIKNLNLNPVSSSENDNSLLMNLTIASYKTIRK